MLAPDHHCSLGTSLAVRPFKSTSPSEQRMPWLTRIPKLPCNGCRGSRHWGSVAPAELSGQHGSCCKCFDEKPAALPEVALCRSFASSAPGARQSVAALVMGWPAGSACRHHATLAPYRAMPNREGRASRWPRFWGMSLTNSPTADGAFSHVSCVTRWHRQAPRNACAWACYRPLEGYVKERLTTSSYTNSSRQP